jgi:cytochrome c oxidase subunit III
MSSQKKGTYYLPGPTHWPIIGSIAIVSLLAGAANWLHHKIYGPYMFLFGAFLLAYMMYGWFGTVIKENRKGMLANAQVDRSFRWGMIWFIFTEVMFFATFFGALFYSRNFVVPWLGGATHGAMTHLLLWPNFHGSWPVYQTPDPSQFTGPKAIMETWGIPAINTIILLTSGLTLTVAHWALIKNRRNRMLLFQLLTVILGIAFLAMQAHEYWLAYTVKGLKLTSGIFGTTFFMLTGFHAMHVTVGTIMLITVLYRMYKGDFTRENHFGFEAVAWYWHFVDVVWLMLFIFVYWV